MRAVRHDRSPQPFLPTEIIIQTLEHIDDKRDLLTACLVSNLFSVISTPLLYRKLEINVSDIPLEQQDKLFKTMETHRISLLVTTVIVTLSKVQLMCPRWLTRHAKCICDGYDKKLGDAISSMTNLRVLDFDCNLCCIRYPNEKTHRHEYLSGRMQTRVLQHFTFSCRCIDASPPTVDHMPISLLESPIMSTVTSLGLACSGQWFFNGADGMRKSLVDSKIAPLLRVLGCGPRISPEPFLEMRSITHLNVPTPINLHEQVFQSGRKLETLLTHDILGWLPSAIADKPDIYANLRFIGAIECKNFEISEVLRILDPIRALKGLNTLEIKRIEEELPNEESPSESESTPQDPSEELMQRLTTKHQSLRRVLIQVAFGSFAGYLPWKPTLWEMQSEGHWASREVPHIGQWKLLNGGLDNA